MADYLDYFNSRINQPIEPTDLGGKLSAVSQARDEKIKQLNTLAAEQRLAEAASRDSLIGQLGIDKDSLAGSALNLVAKGYTGAFRQIGNLAGLPHALLAGANQANLSEQDIQALARHAQGQATPEDLAQINRKVAPIVPGTSPNAQTRAQAIADLNPNAPTPLSIWTEMNKTREVSRNINKTMDTSSLVEQTGANELNAAAEDAYNTHAPQIGRGVDAIKSGDLLGGVVDTAAGITKLAGASLGVLATNKEAVLGSIVENAPQLATGLLGKTGAAAMLASNVGNAADVYNQGIQNYQLANGGALPPEDVRQRMVLQAELHAASEQAGDMTGLAIGKLGAKATVDATRTGLVSAAKKSAGAIAGGFLSESLTEDLQTYLEGEITGKPATGAQMFAGGLIGGASGAGLSGGMRIAHEAAVLASQPSEPKADIPVDPSVVEAVATGKVDHLIDPTKSTYAPDTAIRALFGHSQLETTSVEAKQANLVKADEILSDLQAERETVQARLDDTPKKRQAQVDQYKAALTKTDPANVEMVGRLQEAIKGAEEDLSLPELTASERNAATARVTQLDRLIKSSSEARDSLSSLVQPKAAVDLLVQEADQPGSVDAVQKVLTLAMASPQRLTAAQATQLADNPNNALTAPERAVLREFSTARIAENELMDMGGVSADIYIGAKNKGIAQYRANFGRALTQANQTAADLELGGLTKFEQDHQAKAKTAAKALGSGMGTQIVSDGQGGWSIPAVPLSRAALKKNGGLAINSGRLVENIQKEANALTKVRAEMETAYANKFNVSVPGASNVKNVSQTRSVPQAQSNTQPTTETAQIPTVTTTGASSTAINSGAVSDKSRTESRGMKGDGVTQSTEQSQSTQEANASTVRPETTQELETSTAKADSTEDTTVNTVDEQTEQTVTPEPSSTSPEGKDAPDQTKAKPGLTALREGLEFNKQFEGKKRGEVFRLLNKAAAWLTQRKTSVKKDADIAKVRPLVDIQNFLSQWNLEEVTPETFFPNGLDETEQGALENFREVVMKWFNTIGDNFIYGSLPNSKGELVKSEWAYQDPIQDFFNKEDGSIDENIITAVAYAAYSWFNESSGGTARNTNEQILGLHGLKEGYGATVTPEGGEALRLITTTRDSAITNLGGRILDVLGLKLNEAQDPPSNYLPVLTAAFGAHALRLLEQENLIETLTFSAEELRNFIDGIELESDKETRTYVQITRNDDLTLGGVGKQIKDASKDSHGVLDKLFGSTRSTKEADTKPIPYAQEKAKRTGRDVPKEQQEVLAATHEVPHRVIPKMWDALQVLGDNVFLVAAGAKENSNELVQAENRDAVETQNESLIHQLDAIKGKVQPFADKGLLGQAFYVAQEAWKNYRAGIATQDLNMQSSKIARAMLYRPEWESTIRLDDEVAMEQFQIGLAQALGIKVDTQPNDKTIENLNNMLFQETDNRIVELSWMLHQSIQNPKESVLSETDKESIGEFAAKKEGMQTLQAMVALGEYLHALKSGDESAEFTVHMLVGADGKTNGPMLTLLALGAANTAKALYGYLNRGGFYSAADKVKNFSHWYNPANHQDLYQDFISKVIQKLDMGSAPVKALQVITKELVNDKGITSAARTLGKTPQTGFNYGSSAKTAVRGMQESLVQSVFDRIEEVATGEDKRTSVPQLIAAINTFIADPKLKIALNTKGQDLMDMQFSKQQKKALLGGFGNLLGETVENTLSEYYGTLIERRNGLNKAAQVSFHIYNIIYQDLRDQEMERLMDAKEIAVQEWEDKKTGEKKRRPLHDMSIQQEQALLEKVKDLLPLAHTAFSKEEENLNAGILMAKTKKTKGPKDLYQPKVQFGTEHNGAVHALANGMKQVESNPGVSGLAYFIQSLDSALMHRSIKGTQTMNVHDEAANGADKINKTAGAINAQVWSSMLKFSPTTEVLDMLGRVITNAVTLAESGQVSQETLGAVRVMLRSSLSTRKKAAWNQNNTSDEDLAFAVLSMAKENQYQAELIRLTAMSEMTIVDQYTWEGGEYAVTTKDREEAKALLAAHIKEGSALSADLDKAAVKLGDLFTKAGEAKPQVNKEAVIEQEEAATKKPSPNKAVTLPRTGSYTAKDQLKSDKADWFIGVGSEKSSTAAYAKAWGNRANAGMYEEGDTVFVSAEGNRTGREKPDFNELGLAVDAGVTFITDNSEDRARSYNIGEREVAAFLSEKGYSEVKPGVWKTSPLDKLKPQQTESPFAKLGTSSVISDPDLVEFFEKNNNPKVKQVLDLLVQKFNDKSLPNQQFNRYLLKMLSKAVDPATTIKYITRDKRNQVKELERPARAWFTLRNGKGEIFVLSPEFEHSGLTTEALLHELVHAAVTNKIHTGGVETKPYVDELYSLLEKAQKFVKDNKLSEWNYAVSNIDEMVAFGMTNDLFQQRVLAQITLESKVTGFKVFIQNLTAILFGGWAQKPGINTGMEALIGNVTNLMSQASQGNTTGNETVTLAMASQQSPVDAVNTYSTLDIFNAIDNGTLEQSFQAHLRDLLSGIVEKLHGPFGSFKEAMRKSEAGNPLAVWLKAIETGKAPFASSILASGFTGNSQQDFAIEQVEATVRAALNSDEVFTRESYRELSALFTESQSRLQASDFLGGDWKTNTLDEAQALYDFVFKLNKSNGDRSDYLARFAALGLAHQGFNKLLQVPSASTTKTTPRTFAARVQKVFEDILEFFHNKYTHTYKGQQADEKLTVLVEHLVSIEAKKRHAIAREAGLFEQVMEPVEEAGEKAVRAAHRAITKIMSNPTVRNHSNAFVRGTFSLARGITRSRIDGTLQAIIAFRDSQTKGVQGFLAGLISNVKNPTEAYQWLLLASKKNEKLRKREISHIGKFALESFIDKGRGMSKQVKGAITSVFLRTGAHVLLNHMDMAGIEKLLSDKTEIDKSIASFEDQLTQFGDLKGAYIEDANGLGYWKATGINRVLFMKTNATQIAKRFGSTTPSLSETQLTKATDIINVLVTLYALKYTNTGVLATAREVLKKENARPTTEGNGIEYALLLAKNLEIESLARLFKGNPAQMVHGFTPEIYNYRTLLVTANEHDGAELVKQGYSKGAQVPTDPADPDTEVKHLYRLSDGGMSPHITGVIGYYGTHAKGSNVHSGYMNLHTATGTMNQQTAATIQSKRNQAQQRARNIGLPANRDMSREKGSYMAPIYNEAGDITNWRYLMAESTKDVMLERTNDFDKILGTLAGTVIGKPSTIEQNREAVKVMLDQFNNEFATRGKDYIKIGPKSADPELREMWHLLPNETKEDIREIWGTDEVAVRSDALDILFGYRKLSAADMFHKANDERKNREEVGLPTGVMTLDSINLPQKAMVAGMEWVLRMVARGRNMSPTEVNDFAKRAAKYAAMGEKGWQEIVHETKDILIVKSGITLAGNILSNFSMLFLQGVPVVDMVTSTLTAFRGATTYQEDSAELAKLQNDLKIGRALGNEAKMKQRILVLEDAIARNPVSKLIDAGLMPTIVEDLAEDEDVYSYKSALTRKVSSLSNKVNPTVVKAARTLYMAHDTKMYQGLSRITQLSDFVARYALYQHQTTRKKNPLTEKEAILRASEAFVNYDIPMHRAMQYSDDMGITMFTKYFLFIQRELWRAGKEQPARLYSMMLLTNFMSLGPIVLESSIFRHIGNDPFRSGALGFPGSLDRLMTVKAALAVVK